MKKKKKLQSDKLQQIIDSRDMQAFEEFFREYEVTATNVGKSTCNAFYYKNLSAEHIQFLIDNGLNPNSDCGFGYPAISHQASNKEAVNCLLKNGADINYVAVQHRECALGRACSTLNVEAVNNLLEANASIDVTADLDKKILIDATLAHCDNVFIPKAVEICEMLLKAGAKTSDKTKKYVSEIGKRYEFLKSSISPELVDVLSKSLLKLYEIFDVAPVAPRVMSNITEEITVKSDRWQEQYEELRQKLVPGRGKAETIQGEMIRIVGKVTYEILDNGGINWDEDYSKMVHSLIGYMKSDDKTDPGFVAETCNLVGDISSNSGKEELYRLTELVVKWVISNPKLEKLGAVEYSR